ANGPFALLEPGPGFIIEKLRPEGQQIERAFREAVKTRTGSDVPAGAHHLSAGGRWGLHPALHAAPTHAISHIPPPPPSPGPPRRHVARPARRLRRQWLGREVRRDRSELERTRAALHAAVAERLARHRVAGGVHHQPRQVDSSGSLGPAEIAAVIGPGGRATT